MIQQTHLTAWQSFAPWPKRSQVEQDLRLSRGVAAIFADSVLADHVAMRGGTVLHKAHLYDHGEPPRLRSSGQRGRNGNLSARDPHRVKTGPSLCPSDPEARQ